MTLSPLVFILCSVYFLSLLGGHAFYLMAWKDGGTPKTGREAYSALVFYLFIWAWPMALVFMPLYTATQVAARATWFILVQTSTAILDFDAKWEIK